MTISRTRGMVRWILLSLVPAIIQISLPVSVSHAQPDSLPHLQARRGAPILLHGDTLFHLYAPLGPFTPAQRADAASQKLHSLVRKGRVDSILTSRTAIGTNILADSLVVLTVTDSDAAVTGMGRDALASEYGASIREYLNSDIRRHTAESLLIGAGIAAGLLVGLILIFWLMRVIFPRLYALLERWEGTVLRPLRVGRREILSAGNISGVLIALAKAVRLVLSLACLYVYIVTTLSLFPWTQRWQVRPVLVGTFLGVLTTVVAVVLFKSIGTLIDLMNRKVDGWKGTAIKAVRLKTVEVLSEERIANLLKGAFQILRLVAYLTLGYAYVTILFSLFSFTQTWAETLFGYIMNPLWDVIKSFLRFVPNLFFILVIAYVTRYVIKFTKFLSDEVAKGTLTLPGFYREWADPTYKIVRFLILVFAAIVIFPYLPGSDSPIFQGVSIFLGVLFSLGSTSAVANIVAGVVLTYMRPFTIGDRVKIADTVGDVTEKTLLVTRVRTIKNVDVTIPNAMVLGSHIINFSSSARNPGLILHTSVTIGYSVPWKTVHELLISAATTSTHILHDPAPFVLQTSLDDSYVKYELNAYTNQPNMMASIYSELHRNIQDAFNAAGVEIMSPQYSAVRDGNRTTIPDSYLPRSYQAPAFRFVPVSNADKIPDPGSQPPDSGEKERR
jgi:small-conductance mechanosensitive channel